MKKKIQRQKQVSTKIDIGTHNNKKHQEKSIF